MEQQTIHLLMAGRADTSATIEAALRSNNSQITLRHAYNRADLLEALDACTPHLIFSELACEDFSALDLMRILSGKYADIPVLLIKGTGPDEITIDCMALGGAHVIERTEHYLRRLPHLVDASIRQAARHQARRSIEKRLTESEELYLDVFDNTSDLIQCLAPDGSFLYTNKAWRNAMGYSEEEVKTLNLLDVLHPDSTLCCQERFSRLKNGESLSCIDFKFVAKSGEARHLYGDCGSIIKDGTTISTRGIFKNMTQAIQAEEALKRSEARYAALYENAPDIYTTLNSDGTIASINRIGASMLGYGVGELIGESAAKVIHPEDQRTVFAHLEKKLNGSTEDGGIEYRKVCKDGSILWVHQRTALQLGTDDPRFLVICRDVTEKRNLEAQLAHQASHDTLTNLINRREFERRLERVLSSAAGPTSMHALCFLDLDQFKTINDTCGHIAGDELLRQVAALLQGKMRARDTLARFGGDEFAILMEYCPIENAAQLAQTLRETVEAFEFHWRAHCFSIGVSIGVVAVREGDTLTSLLTRADAACYTAKKAGKNRVHLDPSVNITSST